jgi:hypothetical protein
MVAAAPPLNPAQALTPEDLLSRGYFPDRLIPPVNSLTLAAAIPEIIGFIHPTMGQMIAKKKTKYRSQCVTHSVPKRKHLRRSLSIPNPLHQSMLAVEIATHWDELRDFCSRSPLALSSPTLSRTRALSPREDLGRQPFHRAQRSIGARYLLKSDIARFYPSIYTHSIGWAIHGKAAARNDKKFGLLGNRLDLWVRETQDKQTGGIPIGPDTSFLLGELVGSAIDIALQAKIRNIRGTRSNDDYFLYFDTVSEAENALAVLHGATRDFELEVNDPKTEIVLMPDTLEPAWKADLRSFSIRPSGQAQATDLVSLFDKAFTHARQFPSDSVLTYVAKQVLSADITEENWKLCESLLLRAAIGEPTMLSVLEDIYDVHAPEPKDIGPLSETLYSLCSYHAPLQQGNEVAWSLWLARKRGIQIPRLIAEKIAGVDDDIVALTALDLRDQCLLDCIDCPLWEGYASAANLYENHWLLAYEGHEHGWLINKRAGDYVGNDAFFSILKANGVRFYGGGLVDTSSYFSYLDDEEPNKDVEAEVDEGDFPDNELSDEITI